MKLTRKEKRKFNQQNQTQLWKKNP
jgi:hypothetical protein